MLTLYYSAICLKGLRKIRSSHGPSSLFLGLDLNTRLPE